MDTHTMYRTVRLGGTVVVLGVTYRTPWPPGTRIAVETNGRRAIAAPYEKDHNLLPSITGRWIPIRHD